MKKMFFAALFLVSAARASAQYSPADSLHTAQFKQLEGRVQHIETNLGKFRKTYRTGIIVGIAGTVFGVLGGIVAGTARSDGQFGAGMAMSAIGGACYLVGTGVMVHAHSFIGKPAK